MTTPHEDERLQSDLEQLRVTLRAVSAPPPDDAALRAAFRDARRRRVQAAKEVRIGMSWRVPVAAAAVVVLAIAAVLGALLFSVERPITAPTVAREPVSAPLTVAAFQPLQSSPALLPSDSYSVVRVRIPLSALALVPGSMQDGTVEADLLVGEDGLARGIRFMPAAAQHAAADAR
jgi:hypothetical protein